MRDPVKKQINYDSDEAARPGTIDGWISSRGNFHRSEHLARYEGCTHVKCDCGDYIEKPYGKCDQCGSKSDLLKYQAMPFIEWDGTTPIMLHDDDELFCNEGDILSFCENNDLNPDDLRLVVCEPQYAYEIDTYDIYNDLLPVDMTLEDVAPELVEAIEDLNKKIRNYKKPLSWTPGKYRTSIKIK